MSSPSIESVWRAIRRAMDQPWLGAAFIAALALAARLLPGPRTIDDAFITFRYARNLLDGLGFVYNLGERVLGTTTPLYTLLMAALAALTGSRDFPWIALLINAAADALTCLLLIQLGARLTGRRSVGAAAALLWAIAPMSVSFAVGGMETSVFILLLTAAAYLYLGGRTRAAALASALLLLARPDGALFAGLLIADLVIRGLRARPRRAPWAEAGVFLAALAPWAIFATLYFGSPIPNSILAKAEAYRLGPSEALVRLIQHYSTPFFEHDWLGRWWQLAGFAVYFFLNLIAARSVLRRDSRAWPLAVYPWLYFAAFALANPLIFRWYLAPPLPFYFLLILAGLARLGGDLIALVDRRRPPSTRVGPSAFVLLPSAFFLLTSLSAWTLAPDHGPQRPAPRMAWHRLELFYEQVGRELAPRVAPQRTVIAAGDVGALGYYSGARILDTVGLMSPQTAAYYPATPDLYVINYAVPPDLILDFEPDYVVLLEVYGRNGLFRDPRFVNSYRLADAIPSDIYGSNGLLIYERIDP